MSARGCIAAGDSATAEAGAEALRAGGNAIDAAVAAGFACFTAETVLATPGGAGMMVVRHPEHGTWAVDLFCRAPGVGGSAPARLDFVSVEVDFGSAKQVFHVGRGAAAPPTAVAGLIEAHARFGRLPLRAVLAPAVRVAHAGTPISHGVAFVIKLLEPIVRRSAGSRALYAPGGRLLAAGDRHANPDLGRVIERIAVTGVDPLTRGDLVGALVREFGAESGGLITEADLRGSKPAFREPLVFGYGGRTVVTCPPPATGGKLVAATLARLGDVASRGPFLGAGHLRAVAGALREVARDRARLESASAVGSTTQVSVLDASGGAAALTLSSGECCGEVLSGTGIHLNNFLGEEDINPGGFHRHAPGAPIPTMMSPAVVLAPDGEPELALGSGGSNRLRSAIAQAIVNLCGFGAPLADAVRAPRLHVEGHDLAYERVDLPQPVADALEADFGGAAVRFPARNMYFGGVHVAARRAGRFEGAGDARRGGAAMVVA